MDKKKANKSLSALVMQVVGILAAMCGAFTIVVGIKAGYGIEMINVLVLVFGIIFFIMGLFQRKQDEENRKNGK